MYNVLTITPHPPLSIAIQCVNIMIPNNFQIVVVKSINELTSL